MLDDASAGGATVIQRRCLTWPDFSARLSKLIDKTLVAVENATLADQDISDDICAARRGMISPGHLS